MDKPQPESIMDEVAIEKIFETEIPQRFDFIEREAVPGLYPGQLQRPGLAWRKLKLSTIRGRAGLPQRTEDFDEPILLALNSLCRKGKVLIFDVRSHRDLEYHDVLISMEIGYAMKSYYGNNPPTTKIIRHYSTQPLSKRELSKLPAILDPKARIEEIRHQRDKRFRQQFGWSNEVEIEKELRRIDREAELELRRNIEALLTK